LAMIMAVMDVGEASSSLMTGVAVRYVALRPHRRCCQNVLAQS
jgi:hypothetical protein